MTDNEIEHAPKPGRRRSGLVAAAVVGVLAVGGGTAYLVSSGSGHTVVGPGSSVSAVAPSPSSSGGMIQPGGPNRSAPSGKGVAEPATSYLASGSTLTVYFYGRACMRYTVTADESTAGKVVVQVTGYSTARVGEMCSMLVYLGHQTTTLKAPLNGRSVEDGHTAKNLPVQMGLPGNLPSGRVTHGPVTSNSN